MLRFALTAALLLPLATACGADDAPADGLAARSGEYTLQVVDADWVPEVGRTSVHLHLSSRGGPVAASDLAVEPWMPQHGHGSSVRPRSTDLGDGTWLVEDLVFTMPGRWELRVTCTIDGAARRFVVVVDPR